MDGDNLHEMSNPEKNKKNITNLSSAELAQRVEKFKLFKMNDNWDWHYKKA